MSTITIKVSPHEVAFIRAGFNPAIDRRVTVDLAELTPEQRGLLADGLERPWNSGDEYAIRGGGASAMVDAPTLEAVLAAITRVAAQRAEAAARKAAAREATMAEAAEVYAARRTKRVPLPNFPTLTCDAPDWPSGLIVSDGPPQWREWERQLSDERDRLVDAEQVRREAAEKAEKAEKAAARRELRAWADGHGSDLLRDLIAEDLPWRSTAVDEWVAAHTPDGWVVNDPGGRETDLLRPTREAVTQLRAARETAQADGRVRNPRLKWLTWEAVWDEVTCDHVDERNCAAVLLDLAPPAGRVRTIYLSLGEVDDEGEG